MEGSAICNYANGVKRRMLELILLPLRGASKPEG